MMPTISLKAEKLTVPIVAFLSTMPRKPLVPSSPCLARSTSVTTLRSSRLSGRLGLATTLSWHTRPSPVSLSGQSKLLRLFQKFLSPRVIEGRSRGARLSGKGLLEKDPISNLLQRLISNHILQSLQHCLSWFKIRDS
jgi:hypothetical protein